MATGGGIGRERWYPFDREPATRRGNRACGPVPRPHRADVLRRFFTRRSGDVGAYISALDPDIAGKAAEPREFTGTAFVRWWRSESNTGCKSRWRVCQRPGPGTDLLSYTM